jgi:hypothetical protein
MCNRQFVFGWFRIDPVDDADFNSAKIAQISLALHRSRKAGFILPGRSAAGQVLLDEC